MGKRELVLISLFVVIGIVVYQFTASPPPPGSEGVTFGGIIGKLKREIRGNRETATATVKQAIPVDLATRLVRINLQRTNDLTIIGSDRNDISVEMTVSGRGFDQNEAKAAAAAAQLKLEQVGDAIAVAHVWPASRDGRGVISQGTFTVHVPRRLLIRVEPHVGKLLINDVGGVEVMGSRGETHIKGSTGHVILTHTGGALEIDNVPSLKLTSRNSRGSVKRVAGTLSVEGTGGELELAEIGGPLEVVESRNIEWRIDASKTVKPPLRFNGTGGRLRIEGLRSEARIDGRNLEMDITLTAAAPITIYNTGEDILITPPSGGYTLDAVATEGKITSVDSNITATPGDGQDARASAPIRGGGPQLTLRVTRGRIDIRKAATN